MSTSCIPQCAQTARTTWFGYLGALAFTFISVIRVQDVDYFSADATTQLPIVNLAVPVESFMWAGALLLTVVFGYLHVFLELIWYDLGKITSRYKGRPISGHVQPWLITELGLNIRLIMRAGKEAPCHRPSILGLVGVGVSGFLGWIAAPLLVGFFWFRSMPAHDLQLTMLNGFLFWLTLLISVLSFFAMRRKMK